MNETETPGLQRVHIATSEDIGRIADPKVAEEIAYVEKDQGRDAALATEQELKKQNETGLDANERNNVELMEGVKSEYPDGVISFKDEAGRSVAVLVPPKMGEMGSNYVDVMTQLGIFQVDLSTVGGGINYDKINWSEFYSQVLDARAGMKNPSKAIFSIFGNEQFITDEKVRGMITSVNNYFRVQSFDVADENQLKLFQHDLEKADERGKKAREADSNLEGAASAGTIL